MKRLARVLIAIAALLLLLAGGALVFLDPLVAAAIERGGTWAAGVETSVGEVDASPLSGRFSLTGLSLANPPGFRAEPFLQVASASASWDNGSVLSKEIRMDELAIEGVSIQLEKSGAGTNWGAILDHLEKLSPKGTPTAEAAPARALSIRRIEIRDVRAGLHLSGVALVSGSTEVKIPRIVIEDFRSDGSTTQIVGKLVRAVLQAILEEVLSAGQGIFPADITKDLGRGLSGLKGAIESGAKGVLKDVGDALKGAGDLLKPR